MSCKLHVLVAGLGVLYFLLSGCMLPLARHSLAGYYSAGLVPVTNTPGFTLSSEAIGRLTVRYWLRLDPDGRYESGRQLFWDGEPSGERFSVLPVSTTPLYQMCGGSKGSWTLLGDRLLLRSDDPVQSWMVLSNYSPEGNGEARMLRTGAEWAIVWGNQRYSRTRPPNAAGQPSHVSG